jgi:tetratricopeptide (TPR) repeat protein
METYRLNSRVSSNDREYLIQTVNDVTNHQIRSSIFAEGQLLETVEENVYPNLAEQDVLELVKTTHKERMEEVEHLFERYRDALQSNDVEQIDYLALALMYKKMYNEAEALFRRAVSLRPEGHEALNHLGQVLMMQRKYAEAVEALGKCVEAQPRFADYRNHLGEAFLAAGSCKRAMIEFDEAITINIYYGDAYYNKALAYVLNSIRREDFKLFSEASEKILENFERATVVCPEYLDKNFEEGQRLLAEGDLEGAYNKLLLSREKKKEQRYREFSIVYLKFMLATDKIDEKTLRRRVENLKEAIAKNPHFPDLHYDLGVAYTLMGRFIHSKAIKEYQEALRINPDFERAKRSLRLAENEFRGFDALVKAILKG